MATKNNFYAYLIPGGPKGVTDKWQTCESIVKGVEGARYKGFKNKEEASDWLASGASYGSKTKKKLTPGIYFDAGTGRGKGVEISVTDERGVDLLYKGMPKKKLNRFGKYLIKDKMATNNYGELLALNYAIKIAGKSRTRNIFGDSSLVINFWSKWIMKRDYLPEDTIKLAKEVSMLRSKFEKGGGSIKHISGDDNPADLGFHK
ncbi:MAG: ribonuclease H family protein [Patescibacteria group bacterium]|nr:ribonuclease H family protein [Patescibacteria group bacterium]MCL5224034.1 ribonuclease H family protein [Patescibacteria group bacterium]